MSGQWPPEWEDEEELAGASAGGERAPGDDVRQAEVAAYLASVPVPVLPAGIEARISTAIAAESASRATDTASTADQAGRASAADGERPLGPTPGRARFRRRPSDSSRPGGSVRHRGPGRRDGLTRRFLQIGPLLALVVIVAGLGYVVSRAGSSSSSSAGSAAAAPAAGADGTSGASSAAAAGGPEAGPTGSASAASGAGSAPSPLAPNAGASVANPGPAAIPLFTVTESGTKYRQAALAAQVRAALAALGTDKQAFATLPQTPALAGCVRRVTGGQAPQLVDRAAYQGTAAYVIASSSRVWVVGTGCTAASPHLIESVPLAG
jgi:hypothetical protein